MEDKNDSGLENQNLSVLGRKYIVTGIIFFSLLIAILIALIAEAYVNQHPVFEFLQYAVFKPETVFLGSISLIIFYIASLFMAIAACFFALGAKWKRLLLIFTIIGLILISISFVLSLISYDWRQEYSIARYISSILLAVGTFGQLSVLIISNHNIYELNASKSKYSNKLLNFPFYILMFVSIIINSILL